MTEKTSNQIKLKLPIWLEFASAIEGMEKLRQDSSISIHPTKVTTDSNQNKTVAATTFRDPKERVGYLSQALIVANNLVQSLILTQAIFHRRGGDEKKIIRNTSDGYSESNFSSMCLNEERIYSLCINADNIKAENFVVNIAVNTPQQPLLSPIPRVNQPIQGISLNQNDSNLHFPFNRGNSENDNNTPSSTPRNIASSTATDNSGNDIDSDNSDDYTPLERLYREMDKNKHINPQPKKSTPRNSVELQMGFFSNLLREEEAKAQAKNESHNLNATRRSEKQSNDVLKSDKTNTSMDLLATLGHTKAQLMNEGDIDRESLRLLRGIDPEQFFKGFIGVDYVGPSPSATTGTSVESCEQRSPARTIENEQCQNQLHSLGRIMYLLFSRGASLPPSLFAHDDDSPFGMLADALTLDDPSDNNQLKASIPKEKQRRIFDADSSETEVFELLHEKKKVPRPVCQLIYDLLKSNSYNDGYLPESAFGSLEDVSAELISMITQPDIFLHDGSSQTSLQWDNNKLYGRINEMEQLFDAMAAAKGESRYDSNAIEQNHLVLVSGFSGSGKSSLISSAVPSLKEFGWILLEAKFDNRSARHPLSVIMNAFEGYFAAIFADETSLHYRQHIGRSLQALIPLTEVPFLEKLVPSIAQFFSIICPKVEVTNCAGPSSLVEDEDRTGSPDSDFGLSSSEHKMNRLCCLFQLIIHAMNSGGRPLLFFFDDIQFADKSAMELIESFMCNSQEFARDIEKLQCNTPVFVGTYRDNEVDDTNNLQSFLACMKESSHFVRLTEIHLETLSATAVHEMISETLRLPKRITKSLAEVTISKTDGSPLFLRSFLNSMVDEGKIYYSLAKRRWMWDVLALSEVGVDDGVAVLLARKLLRLPINIQSALRIASCFGMRVEDWMIMDSNVLVNLNHAVDEGLMERFGSTFVFVHASVHSAAYNLIPGNERSAVHMKLGLEIIFNKSAVLDCVDDIVKNLPDSKVFAAIDQINRSRSISISNPAMLRLFSEMNLRAGNACIDMSDFQSAQKNFLAGRAFMDATNWVSDYGLMLALTNGLCLTSYVNGDSSTLIACVEEAMLHAQNHFEDKFVAYSVHIKFLVSRGCETEAIECVLNVLNELGESFPQSSSDWSDLDAAKATFFTTKHVLDGAGIDSILLCPNMVDKRKMWAMKLMNIVFLNLMQSSLSHTILISCRMISITMSYGVCDSSAFGFVAFAIASLSLLEDFEFSYRMGRVGIKLLDQIRTKSNSTFAARVKTFFTMFLNVLVDPFQATLDVLDKMHINCMRKGDVDTAAQCASFYFHLGAMTGMNLHLLRSKFVQVTNVLSRKKQQNHIMILNIVNSFVSSLLGSDEIVNRCTSGAVMSQDQRLRHALSKKKVVVARMIYFYQMQECFWKRDFENAYTYAERHSCQKGPALLKRLMLIFYKGLMDFYFARSKGGQKWIDEGLKAVKELQSWYEMYNWNYENKYFILMAEYYNTLGDLTKAIGFYEKAIESARNHRFPHEEGLSLELTGYFHLRLGDTSKGLSLIRESCIPYKAWGATVKVEMLETFLSSDVTNCPIY